MKKIWMAGTVLAGVAAAQTAHAQGVEMTFSGSLDYQFVWSDADQQAPGTGFNISSVSDQSELVWDANGMADNGLKYGANIQWRFTDGGGAGGGAFDEAYLKFAGDWGTIHFGADDDVVDNMATGGHDVMAHSEGFDGEFGDYYTQLGDAGFLGTEGSSGDANKIAYYTPSFGGFEAGVSYTPEDGTSFQSQGTDTSSAYYIFEGSVAYGATFNDAVDVTASLGTRFADAEDNTSGNEQEDIRTWRAGLKLGFGSVEVGAGYGDNGDSGCVKGTSCDAGTNYQFGLGWDYGLGRFAVGYAHGEETNNNGTEDEIDVYNISIDAGIAEGLLVYGDLVFADSNNGQGGAANENEGTVLLVGTNVQF